jgi:hypothetical protein
MKSPDGLDDVREFPLEAGALGGREQPAEQQRKLQAVEPCGDVPPAIRIHEAGLE